MWNVEKKKGINKLIYKTERVTDLEKTNKHGYQVVRWEGRDKLGDRDSGIHTVLCYA